MLSKDGEIMKVTDQTSVPNRPQHLVPASAGTSRQSQIAAAHKGLLLSLASCLFLAACGGAPGSSDSGTSDIPDETQTAPANPDESTGQDENEDSDTELTGDNSDDTSDDTVDNSDGDNSDTSEDESETVVTGSAQFDTAPVVINEYLGSLYSEFHWAGPLRDPMRDEVEVANAYGYEAMTEAEKNHLYTLSSEHDIIMQIGGMGSAKSSQTEGEVNEKFADYMDSVIADGGLQWRTYVTERALEVSEAQADGSTIYWQIGNEINADSYTENVLAYFNNDTQGLSDTEFTIKVYVEYFLAPTLQAFQAAETLSGNEVLGALGSVASFSSQKAQGFLDEVMNYEIEGTYAPELTGTQVHELLDLLTIHYLAHASTLDDPESWANTLRTVHDKWVKDNIRGIWTTEEVGIRLASGGAGAGAALLVQSRYWQWISQNHLSTDQTRFFYYGTTAGPQGQRIDDAITNVYSLIGEDSIVHVTTQHDRGNELDVYLFYVPEQNAYLATVTSLAEEPMEIREITIDYAGLSINPTTVDTSAWRFAVDGTDSPSAQSTLGTDSLVITLDTPVALQAKPETLLFWVK